MATGYIQEGVVMEFTAPSGGVVSGSGYKIGDTFAYCLVTAAEGVKTSFAVRGVVKLPKAATVTPAQGVKLYWDGSAVTTTPTSNTLIGTHASAVAAGASDATINVLLGIVA